MSEPRKINYKKTETIFKEKVIGIDSRIIFQKHWFVN